MIEEKFKKQLESSKTLEEFLNIFASHYDLKGAKLNILQTKILTANIDKLIHVSGAKQKK